VNVIEWQRTASIDMRPILALSLRNKTFLAFIMPYLKARSHYKSECMAYVHRVSGNASHLEHSWHWSHALGTMITESDIHEPNISLYTLDLTFTLLYVILGKTTKPEPNLSPTSPSFG